MRRDFLKLCGLAGLGLAVPYRPSAARQKAKDEPYAGPYYVVFNASGGWDTTYLMDPKGVNGINRLYKEGDILTKGSHKYAPIKKHAKGGMCNEDFYAEFGNDLLTLNGLDYSVNNHDPCSRYMATYHGTLTATTTARKTAYQCHPRRAGGKPTGVGSRESGVRKIWSVRVADS